MGASIIETLLFPLKSWSAEDRVILGYSPQHFGLSPFVLGTYPPRHGLRALIERGFERLGLGHKTVVFRGVHT